MAEKDSRLEALQVAVQLFVALLGCLSSCVFVFISNFFSKEEMDLISACTTPLLVFLVPHRAEVVYLHWPLGR